MEGGDLLCSLQVGHRPGHPEDAVIAPGGQAQPLKRLAEQGVSRLVQNAVPGQLRLTHVGVTVHSGALIALPLPLSGPLHPLLDLSGGLPGLSVAQLLVAQGGDVYLEVDPVQQRPGDPGAIPLHVPLAAPAPPVVIAVPAAFTGVHGADQHELAGIDHCPRDPGDLHPSVLQGLAEHLQGVPTELGQLVQEEDAPQTSW